MYTSGLLVSAMNSKLFVGDMESIFIKHIWMNTISFSYVSYDVPNVFCAASLWEKRKCGLFDILLFFDFEHMNTKIVESTTLFDACHKYRPNLRECKNTTSCSNIKQCSIYPPNDFEKLREMMQHTKMLCKNRIFKTCRGREMMNSEIQVYSNTSNIKNIIGSIVALGYLETNKSNSKTVCTIHKFLKTINITTTIWKLNIGNNSISSSWGYTVPNSSSWQGISCWYLS